MFKSTQSKEGHLSFTIHEKGILRELITDCAACAAFHPQPRVKMPEHVQGKALWDTGATNSAITPAFIKKLGLIPFTKVQVGHADGSAWKNAYKINIVLPNGVGFPFINVTECTSIAGNFDLLIGMDIITAGDFAITNKDGKTVFSFRVPSISEIDFNDGETIIIPTKQAESQPKPILGPTEANNYAGTSRNSLCPCGSGKKFKHCHDKAA